MALLLATTGLVAAGLVGAESAERHRRQRRARALASDPALRAELAMLRAAEEAAVVQLLFVRVEAADLVPQLADTKLQVCVKLGEAGHSIRQCTEKVRSASDGTAQFASTCVFPWRPEHLQPVVRLRLTKIGLIDQVVSKEEFWLPFGFEPVSPEAEAGVEEDVLLFDRCGRGKLLGQLHVAVHLQAIPLAELRRAGLLPMLAHAPAAYDAYGVYDEPGVYPSYGGYPFGQRGASQGWPVVRQSPATPPTIVEGRVVRPGEAVVRGHVVQPGTDAAGREGFVVTGNPVQLRGADGKAA